MRIQNPILALILITLLAASANLQAGMQTIGGNPASVDSANWDSSAAFPMENISALAGENSGNAPLNLSWTGSGGSNYTFGVFHEYAAETFKPSVSLAGNVLTAITWSATTQNAASLAMFPALSQNGLVYKRAGNHNADLNGNGAFTIATTDSASWHRINPNATSSSNLGWTNNHPDLSDTGAPVTFGVFQWWGSTGGSLGSNAAGGADYTHFQVDVAWGTAPLNVVAFGDSTTATRSNIPAVYAQLLQAELPGLLEAAVVVHNEGVGGSHTDFNSYNSVPHNRQHARDRFNPSVRNRDPDVVVMQFGINDSWVDTHLGDPVPTDPANAMDGLSRIPIDRYENNLRYMIETLQADDPTTQIILMTPNKLGTGNEAWRNTRLLQYTNVVRGLAGEYDVDFIDVWQMFEDYDAVAGQGIDDLVLSNYGDYTHPNQLAHRMIADRIEALIIPEPATIALLGLSALCLLRRRAA